MSWLFTAQFSFFFHPRLKCNDPKSDLQPFLFPILFLRTKLSLTFSNHQKDSNRRLRFSSTLLSPPSHPPFVLMELKGSSEFRFPPPQSSSPPAVCRSMLRNPADLEL